MTLAKIFDLINYICVKENSGSTLKPVEKNTVLQAVNLEFFNKMVVERQAYAAQNKMDFEQAIYGYEGLMDFVTSATISSSPYTYPADFGYLLYISTIKGGINKRVELITHEEFLSRQTNLLKSYMNDYPVAIKKSTNGLGVEFRPTNVTTGTIVYLKVPTTPVYDYYLDANLNEIYLPASSTHALTTGETGSAGQTTGTVTSLTVELEWNQVYHIRIVNEILKKISIHLKDDQIAKYASEV